jgi:hypothetical protein
MASNKIEVAYDNSGKPLGKLIADNMESLSYTDVASGKSDSISLTIADIDKEWINYYMPTKGAEVSIKIVPKDWEKAKAFECGTFVIDDISLSGAPYECSLGGVSIPANQDFKSNPINKTWEKATLQEIAVKIAKAAGVKLYYEGSEITIAEIEQNNETDSSFLYSLCEKYGMAVKVYNKKIVIYDPVQYEAKAAVRKISEKEMIKWSYNTTVEGTYTGVTLKWNDADKKRTDPDRKVVVTLGKKGRMYSFNSQVTSRYDAELQAAAKVNEANRKAETMNITVPGEYGIAASQCVQITDLGKINGKYFVDTVKHSVTGSGYTTQLSLHKVQTAIKVNVTQKEKEAEKKKTSSTKKSSGTKKKSGGESYSEKALKLMEKKSTKGLKFVH